MNDDTWWLLNSGASHFAFNMALDEVLLEAMPRLSRPVLRFYAWLEPAASFGYFQKHADVERLTPLRPLVRRPTGGGIVPHDADWTYSLVFPVGSEWYSLKAIASYQRIHQWIQKAFLLLGLRTDLAASACKAQPGQCFAGFEQFDVLFQGRKIAGAAQRRRRDGLLIQGSVQPPVCSLARTDWEGAMLQARQGTDWQKLALTQAQLHRATDLARIKYSQASYNQKR